MFEQAFKNIDDVLHKDAGCSSELDYTEQTSWLLFFGGKERPEVQQNFHIRTGETAFLFFQHFIRLLKAGGARRHRHQEHVSIQHGQRLR